jgi:hypothetical protein
VRYGIGGGSRGIGIELLLEESEKVIVLNLGETRRGTGEIPEGWGSVIHGLLRVGRKGRWVLGRGDIKRRRRRRENSVRGREWVLVRS